MVFCTGSQAENQISPVIISHVIQIWGFSLNRLSPFF